MDLSTYSLAQLKDLSAEISKELKLREKQQIDDAVKQIQQIAQSVGMKVSDLVKSAKPASGSSTRGPVAQRYVNPADPSKTWSGRGRAPTWVNEHLAGGGTKEQLAA